MKLNSLHDLYIGELKETRNHTRRLEQIFERLNESPKGEKCKGVVGIIDEGEDLMDDAEDAPAAVCDASPIAAAQRVEHYEMAAYGTVRTFARRLGYEDQAQLLSETLQEEGNADKKLTSLAESYINEEAKSAR
jgi:ferritin-like metal-binding protein YciE